MFYSHEILTSRKHGVATIWIVATLGPKSTARKVNRKAILDVDVRKACETIIQPEVPMALRLQSNLLFGVSRVYSQQCGYILADAQAAQHALKALLRAVSRDELDPQAGKIRPDQLILEDDPAFLPEMAIPGLDFDFSNMDLERSLQDTQSSLLEPHSQSRRDSDASRAGSVPGLVIPTSDTGGGSYQLPYNDAFQRGIASTQKMSSLGPIFGNEEEAFIDELDFEFDADGKLRNVNIGERDGYRASSIMPQLGRLGSDSAASERVRYEHNVGIQGHPQGSIIDPDGDYIVQFDDEQMILPDAEPFTIGGARRVQLDSDASIIVPTESSSISSEAPSKKRKRKVPKTITADRQIELSNNDLRTWQTNYLANMDAALRQKEANRAPTNAKKNAKAWVFGNGLGDIGLDFGLSKFLGSLSMFSGDGLREVITGVSGLSKSPKRRHNEVEKEDDTRRVRTRLENEDDQIGRGGDDNGLVPIFDESLGLEIGREAQSALEDHASSAMPWNVSASLHSYRALPGPGSSSFQGRGTIHQSSITGGRLGSRLTSASPLLGRGRSDLTDLERIDDYDLLNLDEPSNYDHLGDRGRTLSTSQLQGAEFEIFGPTAAVDTQTAQNSLWIKEALAKESLNFLEYVRNTLREEEIDDLGDDAAAEYQLWHGSDGGLERRESDLEGREVAFETLFPPESNSMMVAAQAFHHVLTLTTKNLLRVRQVEEFGDIWMGVRRA